MSKVLAAGSDKEWFKCYFLDDVIHIEIGHPLSLEEIQKLKNSGDKSSHPKLHIPPEELTKLLKIISDNKPLSKLNLLLHNWVELDENLAKLIAATETKNLALKFLPSGYLEKDLQILAGIIATNQLTNLELSDLYLGNKGIAALTESLSAASSLQSLSLTNNRISDEGAQSLAIILAKNHSLLLLNLSLNDITEKGSKKIFKALTGNSTLQSLNLSYNEIKAVDGLVEFLEKNHHLKDLNLGRNHIEFQKIDLGSIARGLSKNVTLCSLSFDNQRYGEGEESKKSCFKERPRSGPIKNILSSATAADFLKIMENRKDIKSQINISFLAIGKDLLELGREEMGNRQRLLLAAQNAPLVAGLEPSTSFQINGLEKLDRAELEANESLV